MTTAMDTAASIPIIQLWDVLLVPVQGELLDRQAEQLRADVLRKVKETGAKHLFVDVSGVWLMDSHLCSVLAGLASAARYMGAATIITGLSPDIAQTLQSMGLHVGTGRTMRSLEGAFESLGIRPRKAPGEDANSIVRRLLSQKARDERSDP